jgi:probable phosphoglycerate mutase
MYARPTSSLLLLRHGETEWNVLGRLQGSDDSPLTARGLEQAAALAAWTASRGVRRVVCSPLGRARTTAEQIAAACSAPLAVREALAEMSFGECAGLTLGQCEERFPAMLEARARARWEHRWPGGESYADVLERTRRWLDSEPDALAGEVVAVVSHQALNRALLVALTGCELDWALSGAQAPGQAIEVLPDGRSRWIEFAASPPATHAHGVI